MLRNKVFLACVFLFLLFHIIEGKVNLPEILSAYLDDILCLPIMLSGVLLVQRRFIVHDDNFMLPVTHIIFSILYISVLFEIILPGFSGKYFCDPIDFFAYTAGATVFYFSINKTPARYSS